MKAIPDFNGYFADETGNIYSMHYAKFPTEPRLLKPRKDRDGYSRVGLWKDGEQFQRPLHRLILSTFVGPCPEGMQACHNDGNPANNRLENLRWDSSKNNNADKIQHGTTNRGEKNGFAKLNEMQVHIIRRYAKFGIAKREIAHKFGVSYQNISDIVNRRRWQHV